MPAARRTVELPGIVITGAPRNAAASAAAILSTDTPATTAPEVSVARDTAMSAGDRTRRVAAFGAPLARQAGAAVQTTTEPIALSCSVWLAALASGQR